MKEVSVSEPVSALRRRARHWWALADARVKAEGVLAEDEAPGLSAAAACGPAGEDAGPVAALEPGRPPRPRLVSPAELAQRPAGTPEGRAALLHAIAHIEFNAINLALDAVWRFDALPEAFARDWWSVARDEARHFLMLVALLEQRGLAYGAFDAHDGLWAMARRTAHDPLARMALVPRVLEARGLDATPGIARRLRAAGDHEAADALAVILAEEERHVALGSQWFGWLCRRAGVDPVERFASLVREHGAPPLRGEINRAARQRAGFDERELDALRSPRAALARPRAGVAAR